MTTPSTQPEVFVEAIKQTGKQLKELPNWGFLITGSHAMMAYNSLLNSISTHNNRPWHLRLGLEQIDEAFASLDDEKQYTLHPENYGDAQSLLNSFKHLAIDLRDHYEGSTTEEVTC